MTKKLNKNDILKAISSVMDLNKISGLQIEQTGKKYSVIFAIHINPNDSEKMEETRQKVETAILKIKNISKVSAILTAEKQPSQDTNKSTINDPHGMNKNPKLKLPIKDIIVVASGKGGVGKSTVAVNLAAQMAKTGLKVGLLDSDIYGPSVPRLTGLPYKKPDMTKDNKLIPFVAHGLKVMSIGFMVDQSAPLIWRGPMVQSAIYQMLRDVDWANDNEPLDILVIDMPPGTGDAQLTIAQKIDVTGAIIISTPQDLAMIDAVKAIEMFKKTDVPILGLVENMSVHVCSNCGHEEHIFGSDLSGNVAKHNVSYLGAIPLNSSVREKCDAGELSDLENYKEIANSVLSSL